MNNLVSSTDVVYGFGSNKYNKLGLNKKKQLFDILTGLRIHERRRRHFLLNRTGNFVDLWQGSNKEIIQKEKPSVIKNKPPGDDPVVDIIMGRDHSIFVTERGFLYSIGRNSEGQRGLGHERSCPDLTLLPCPQNSTASKARVAAHNFLTCISTTNLNESNDQEYILFCGTRYLEKEQKEIERQKSSSIQSIR